MAKYVVDESTMTGIADQARRLSGSSDPMTPQQMITSLGSVDPAGGYDKGFDAGKQAEYDRFWDLFQDDGIRQDYSYAFYLWDDEIFNPKYIPIIVGNPSNMFRGSTIISVPPISLVSWTMNSMFYNARSLETIEMIILDGPTGDGTNAFVNCSALKNIRFSGSKYITGSLNFSSCPLTNESVQSIIDKLEDRTGKTELKLTLHSDVLMGVTEEQYNAVYAKNWTFG